ncbi:hypothetical protein ANN_09243 [Periplaneta americana]|uniref:HTH psq-type domain-containing protein n=1 Tax=Periplaneta americana TaxID=6978 RepID=A0ABQ8TL75_PERAM|nr:hypothetical protein ANN_09243 [Periplaneta americana]
MVVNVQAAYERSPRKSLRRASRELQVPKSTLQRIVHKRLKLYSYKVQLMQRLEPDDKPKRMKFANTISFSGVTSKCGGSNCWFLSFRTTELLRSCVLDGTAIHLRANESESGILVSFLCKIGTSPRRVQILLSVLGSLCTVVFLDFQLQIYGFGRCMNE